MNKSDKYNLTQLLLNLVDLKRRLTLKLSEEDSNVEILDTLILTSQEIFNISLNSWIKIK